MRKGLKLGCMGLALAMGLSVSMTTQAAVFADEGSSSTWDWSWSYIHWAHEEGIVAGKANNCFDADGLVTRAEAATMMVKFKEIDAEQYDFACEQFEDVGDAWYTKYINAAYANELISGKAENIFDPEGKLTRAEAAALIVSAMDYELLSAEKENVFADTADDAWYVNYIYTAYMHNIVEGKGDGRFEPNASVSRAELVTMLHATTKEDYSLGKVEHLSLYNEQGAFQLLNAEDKTLYYYSDEDGVHFEGDMWYEEEFPFSMGWNMHIEETDVITFIPDDKVINNVSFFGENGYINVEASNADKVTVEADGTIRLYGTDMEYQIMQLNLGELRANGEAIKLSGSSEEDVVIKAIDCELVEISEQ